MIVASVVLVFAALGLLIAGLLVSGGLALIYASIGVSVLAGLTLIAGVIRRSDPVGPES